MKSVNNVVSKFKESIFSTLTNLANQENAINLSQGFPDFEGPSFIIEDLISTSNSIDITGSQYAPMPGALTLRKSISNQYSHFYNINYCPNEEITVTNGATQAIYNTVQALISPGDEVIIFEPFYDSYLASIKMAQGIPVPIRLHAPAFKWSSQELEEKFSSKTKLVILNSPHNPSGRVFSEQELLELSQLVKKYDAYLLSDEVYEFLTFDNKKHIPIANLPDMKNRVITISSIGKTFGFTGLKIGWCCAPENITNAIRMVHQFNSFGCNHIMQIAVSKSLERLDHYLPEFRKLYSDKKELILNELKQTQLRPLSPEGTYFILCEIPNKKKDFDFCRTLIEKNKVATIPISEFYIDNTETRYIRFCFAKKDGTIKKAMDLLKN